MGNMEVKTQIKKETVSQAVTKNKDAGDKNFFDIAADEAGRFVDGLKYGTNKIIKQASHQGSLDKDLARQSEGTLREAGKEVKEGVLRVAGLEPKSKLEVDNQRQRRAFEEQRLQEHRLALINNGVRSLSVPTGNYREQFIRETRA